MIDAQQIIDQYKLLPHPEGGWYKETYKSTELIPKSALPQRFRGDRFFSTAIYFLLEKGNFSAFHRIKSDECWHFYMGGTLTIYVFEPNGAYKEIRLGADYKNGELFQYVVPANSWFASRLSPNNSHPFCFVGCTVAPGFDFNDFELAKASELSEQYPSQSAIIQALCRQ